MLNGVYDMAAGDRYDGKHVGGLIGQAFYDPDANYGGVIQAISWPAGSPAPLVHLEDGQAWQITCVLPHLEGRS